MSRKDFELIARTISALSPQAKAEAAFAFADALRGSNSNFDRQRFITACGKVEEAA